MEGLGLSAATSLYAKMKSMFLRGERRELVFWGGYAAALLLTAIFGGLFGMLLGYSFDLPKVRELQEVRPNVVSYVYSADGKVLGEFALERRILVTYEEIPKQLREAIIAAEDANFFHHSGIDFGRLIVTVFRNILHGQLAGASTLTMQLCKLRFTGPEKRLERKIKDMIFALETEKQFTKEQIFTLYFNQIYMGHGIYGIAAAADFYFKKRIQDLTLAESALLAGVLNVPERYTPIRYPDRALRRRAYALRRMKEEGYITQEQFEEANAEPLQLNQRGSEQMASYFVEWVRQYLEQKYSTEKIWQGGLKIHTTLDSQLQNAAREALREGLLAFDKRTRPWEGAEKNIGEDESDLEQFTHPEWQQIFAPGQIVHGLVLEVERSRATAKLGTYLAELTPKDIEWTKQTRLDRALKKGDVVPFLIESVDRQNKTLEVKLERIPEVQGAFLVLDNKTGAIRAMVGGFDFEYSKFNRATQAVRQPGSIFKVFTYAAALQLGKSPFDTLLDAPVYYQDALGRPYEPKNSDGEYKGLIPLYQALAESRNVPTLRLAKALGIEKVIAMAHQFGIDREFLPVLPIALGAGEISLQDITSAFTVFGNGGVRARPFYVSKVEDFNGVALEEDQPSFEPVLTPEVNSKMIYLLRNVVERGTAVRARALGFPVAGKTGTTNEATDTWFVGFTPSMTAGVWVGYDEKKSLGDKVFSTNLALPIWIDFMKRIEDQLPKEPFSDMWQPSAFDMAVGPAAPSPKSENGPGEMVIEDIPPPTPIPEDLEDPKKEDSQKKAGKEPSATPRKEPAKPPVKPPPLTSEP